jgi:hypothetical protein
MYKFFQEAQKLIKETNQAREEALSRLNALINEFHTSKKKYVNLDGSHICYL